MTKTIYKYDIGIQDEITVEMPKGAEVLTVQLQGDVPCMWAVVDTAQPLEVRRFSIRGTGHPLGLVGEYVATIQLYAGRLVFHVFEEAKR